MVVGTATGSALGPSAAAHCSGTEHGMDVLCRTHVWTCEILRSTVLRVAVVAVVVSVTVRTAGKELTVGGSGTL